MLRAWFLRAPQGPPSDPAPWAGRRRRLVPAPTSPPAPRPPAEGRQRSLASKWRRAGEFMNEARFPDQKRQSVRLRSSASRALFRTKTPHRKSVEEGPPPGNLAAAALRRGPPRSVGPPPGPPPGGPAAGTGVPPPPVFSAMGRRPQQCSPPGPAVAAAPKVAAESWSLRPNLVAPAPHNLCRP